jgi:hypothetical protein
MYRQMLLQLPSIILVKIRAAILKLPHATDSRPDIWRSYSTHFFNLFVNAPKNYFT